MLKKNKNNVKLSVSWNKILTSWNCEAVPTPGSRDKLTKLRSASRLHGYTNVIDAWLGRLEEVLSDGHDKELR